MLKRHYPNAPLLAAVVGIWRNDKILLARRSSNPNPGKWAMPGGLVETGETLMQAAIREVHEETGLIIESPVFHRFHEIIKSDENGKIERHYVLAVFAATSASGQAVAGDDAEAVRWFTISDMKTAPLTDNTKQFACETRKLLESTTS